MSMWSYPANAIINGVLTTERTVRGPLPFTDTKGDQHSESVFSSWTGPELAALGIKLFIENPIPQDYIGGVPVDIETEYQITRTYPGMHLDPGAANNRTRQEIYAKLAYLDGCRVRATSAITLARANGVDPDPADVAKLNEYEAQGVELREQLRALDVANTPLP